MTAFSANFLNYRVSLTGPPHSAHRSRAESYAMVVGSTILCNLKVSCVSAVFIGETKRRINRLFARRDESAKVHPLRYLLNLGCQMILTSDKQQQCCFD